MEKTEASSQSKELRNKIMTFKNAQNLLKVKFENNVILKM